MVVTIVETSVEQALGQYTFKVMALSRELHWVFLLLKVLGPVYQSNCKKIYIQNWVQSLILRPTRANDNMDAAHTASGGKGAYPVIHQ